MKKTILLDALGTLLEFKDPVAALRTQLAARGVEISSVEARKAITAEIEYYRAHILDGRDRHGLDDLRERCTAVLGVELPPHARIVGLREVLEDSLVFEPYEEVAGILALLKDRGHQLVVVSNWDISLHDVLARTGLDELLDGVVVSAQRGIAKPNSLLFAAALATVGGRAAESLHVGDDLEADVGGARAAQIEPVWIDRHGEPPAPEGVRRITSLRGLPELAA